MYKNFILRDAPPDPDLIDFTTDKMLSLKAKGMLITIINDFLMEDEKRKPVYCWSISRATRKCCECRQSLYATIAELRTRGYIDKVGKKWIVRTYPKPLFMKKLEELDDEDNKID